MKSITTLRPLVFLIILCSCVSCRLFQNDDEPKTELDKLPPITQTGENTFGCLINGEAMAISNSLNMTAIYQGGGVQFGGGGVYIVVLDPFAIDVPYDFMDIGEGTSRAKYTKKVQEEVFCFYEYENTYEGFVTFSNIDQENFIISGTFEYSTVTQDCDTIRITNGRFDMQYIP